MNIFEKDKTYIANTYGRFPLEIVRGKGEIVKDQSGKEYIDLGSGIAVNTFGMADESWIEAVTNQLKAFQHTSNLYYTNPCVELAQLICEKTGFKKVFFGNSGAEANECAIKVARKYGAEKKGAEYFNIITLKNSFHGRTVTTLAATGQDVFHKDFLPLTEGFLYAEANNLESVEKLVAENKVCAIMMETIQGEGGVNVLTKEFVEGVYKLCQKEDILLIIDEVQTGNGRTGKLYSYMHYNILPDIFTTAKGLGAGLPIGAAVLNEKVEYTLKASDHGSTFGGNPVCCAGAVNVISRLDEDFLKEIEEKSHYIIDQLEKCDGVISVSGRGFMLGIETKKDAGEVIAKAMELGVLPLKAKNKVRLLPPLNISKENLEKAIDILKKAII